ncbi:FAD-binding oxidoreductase [Novosphingobium sp. 9U]|uniref:NAD(P)/FAD-dependent oxidoreductase n=1 Tax=Novosphingobium sp. 9U TaxID=2653158 RepID=UPI0012EFEECA|nr:FAD-dependent oxidoreductase [Novosphingobium sp. 9U]VWX53997.1 FAD-dependent oxidoreductase [Novosphingobium sp. 9U]
MVDMDRRAALTALGTAAAATAIAQTAQAATRKAPTIGRNLPDITVVGAGAFGAWTALCLRERGAKVTLIDSYGPGNARQTSGDETRQIRAAYGDREIYTRWAMKAFTRWHERQDEFKRRLIYANGVVTPHQKPESVKAQLALFDKLKIPYEMLTGDELAKRWPQGRYDDIDVAMFEPRAGTVKARESIIAASEVFRQKGGTVKLGMAKPGASTGGRITDLALASGERLSTGMAIFACGPWLPTLFPTFMDGFISRRRNEVFYIGSPPGDDRYHVERFPNMYHGDGMAGAGYSLSDVDYGFKVAPSAGASIPMDPDSGERIASNFVLDYALEFVKMRVPGLVGQPVVASRVCTIESSDNGHYIIDTHPEFQNVWIAGGGSGHAFKMGPQTGEYLADRVLGIADPAEEKALFSLASHGRARP